MPEDKLLGPGPGDPPAKKKVVDPWATPEKKKSGELQNKNKQDLKGGTTGASQLSSKSQLPSNVVDPWSKEAPTEPKPTEPKPTEPKPAEPKPAGFDLLSPEKIFEAPTVNVSGKPYAIWEAPPLITDKKTYAEGLQTRIDNKLYTPDDIQAVSKAMKISPLAADAHMRGKPAMGAVINYNDKREKAKTELENIVNDFNSRFTDKATDPGNFGGALTAKYGNAYDINDVLSTPEKTSAFLDKYRNAVEDTFNRKVKHGITVTGGSAVEADTTDYKGIEEAFGKNSAALAEKIVDDVLKENISKDQKVRKIATLVAKRDFQNSESAISERLDPVRYILNAAFNNDTKETIDILNSVKANVEVGISRKTKDEIDYQSALKGAIIEQAMDQASKLTAGSKEAIAFIDGVNKQVDDIDLKIKELSKGYETEKQLEEKYPVLFKQKLVSKINDFNALRSGNVKGDENTPGFAKDDRSLQQFLADEGYDIYDQKVKDIITGDNFKDYSFFGRPLQNFTDVFVNSYKSLTDLPFMGLRDKADRMSEKKAAELFPTQVGENDQYQLTRAAGIGQNIGNTTGQIAGQGILQLATVGAGRLAGLSQVAAVRGAFWTSGTLTSFDSALKDSYDIADTEGGRLAYAGLIAMSNAVSERIFPDVKLFQIPGVAGHIADLSNRIGKPGFNIEMAKELLGKAKSAMVAYAKEGGKEVGQETAEEVITQLFEDGLRYLYGDPNATWDKAMQNAKNTAYQMATGMAAIGAYGAHKSVREERNTSAKGTLYNAALYHDEAMDALDKGFEQGLYSRDELNAKKSVLNTAKNALVTTDKTLATLGAKMDRSEKSLYVANLTAEALLTKQLKDINTEEGVVDVILRTDIEEKIKNLQSQRAELLKGEVKIDDAGNIVKPPSYTVEGKPVKKDKFLEILNGPDANKYDLQVTGDDEVNDLLEKKGGKSEVVDEPKPKRKPQTDDQLATEILSTITGMPEKAETKKAIDYAIDKAVENPSLFEKDYPELFAKIKDRIPTKKIEESLDYHIDKMGDSPNVKILDDMLSERNKSETTTTEGVGDKASNVGGDVEIFSQIDNKGRTIKYFSNTTEKDGVTKTTFTFNRSDKDASQRNNAIGGVPAEVALKGEYTIDEEYIPKGAKVVGVSEIRTSENGAAATVMFETDGQRFQGDVKLKAVEQPLSKQESVDKASNVSSEVIATEAEIVEQKESVPVLHDLLQKSKNKDAALAAISQVNSQTLANLLDELPGSENDAIVEAFVPHMKDGKVDEISLGKDIQEFGGLTSFLSEKLGKKINLKTLTQISNEISGQETETGDTKNTKGAKVAGPSTVSGGNLRSNAEEAKTDDKPKRTIPQSGNKVNAGDKNIKTKEPVDTKPEQVRPANVPGQQKIKEAKVGATVAVPTEIEDKANGLLSALNDGRKGKDIYEIKNVAVTDNHYVLFAENKKGSKLFNIINSEGITPAGMAANWRTNGFKDDLDAISELENVAISPREYAKLSKLNEYTTSDGEIHPIVQVGDIVNYEGKAMEVTASNDPSQWENDSLRDLNVPYFRGKEIGSKQDYLLHTNRIVAGQQKFAEENSILDEADVLKELKNNPVYTVQISPVDFPVEFTANLENGKPVYYIQIGRKDPSEFSNYEDAVAEFDKLVENYDDGKVDLMNGSGLDFEELDKKEADNIFPEPKNVRNLTKAKETPAEISPKEADTILQSWKDYAALIGENEDHSNEVIISIFDASGVFSKPYEDAGYTVIRYDLNRGDDVMQQNWLSLRADIEASGKKVVGVMTAPPCTSMAGSGARWWNSQHDVESKDWVKKKYGSFAAKYFDRPLDYAVALVDMTKVAIEMLNPELFHIAENPVGRIAEKTGLPEPTFVFNPHHFGDPYTKKTLIWGEMNTNLPTANVDPVEGSKMQSKLRGDTPEGKAARSLTPEGFAYAFFVANNTSPLTLDDLAGISQEEEKRNRYYAELEKSGYSTGQYGGKASDTFYIKNDGKVVNEIKFKNFSAGKREVYKWIDAQAGTNILAAHDDLHNVTKDKKLSEFKEGDIISKDGKEYIIDQMPGDGKYIRLEHRENGKRSLDVSSHDPNSTGFKLVISKEKNEQAKPERSTAAITSSAEAIISEAETASEEEEVDTSLEKIEEALNEVESKIGKLTESWSTEDIAHEYPNNVIGKSVKKEITKYAKSIAKQLGWEIPKKNGVHDNIAPAGGEVYFNFDIPGTNYRMSVSAKYEPEYNNHYDNYTFNGFWYRLEEINEKGRSSDKGALQWKRENIAAKEMAAILKREAGKYLNKQEVATADNKIANNKKLPPNSVIREVRDNSGRSLGFMAIPHDGTIDGIKKVVKESEGEMYDQYPEASGVQSRIGATDQNGDAGYVISPNGRNVAIAGTDEAKYILGDTSKAPSVPQIKDSSVLTKKLKEPTSVTGEDGWTFVRMPDGSYTDGDQVYSSWNELKKVGEAEDLGLKQSSKEREQQQRSEESVQERQEEILNSKFKDKLDVWNYINDEALKRMGYERPMDMSKEDLAIHTYLVRKGVDEFEANQLTTVAEANKIIEQSIASDVKPELTIKQLEEEAIQKWLDEEYPNEDEGDIDEGYISFDWDGQILEVFQSRDKAPLEFTKEELIEKGIEFPKGPTAPKSAKAIQRKVRDEEGQKKIDSLIAKFMKGGSPLTMGGLDPERIEAGVELIGEYMKQGIYKFADIIEDFYAKAGDVAKEYFAALKTVYGAYRDGDATEKEYSQMDGNLRNFTYEDIIKSIQNGNDTIISDTNSEAAAGVVGKQSSGRTPGTKQRSSKAKGSSGTSGGMGEQDDTGIDEQGEESRRSSRGNKRTDSGTDGRTIRGENDGQRTSEYQGQTARLKPIPENSSDQNHIIEPSDVIVPDGIPARVAANMDAIILLRTLEEEERNATPEEKKRLAKFVGWGGLAGYLKGIENDAEKTILDNIFLGTEQQVGYYDKTTIPATEKIEIAGKSFDDIAKEVQRKYAQIVSQFPRLTRLLENERALPLDVARSYSIPYLMNPAELQAAGNSTINAHYTDRSVITPIWDLIRKLGFKGGNTLESSAGVGHFFGLMPKDLQDNSNLTGVELDQLTGRILKKLYPDANIQVKGFEQTNFPNNSFDLAVSNVPFASLSVTDVKNKDIQGFSLHNYFIAKNLKQLKPGGIAVMITSKSTMDNAVSAKARRWFLSPEGGNSELVGAIRLPNNAFDKNAATQVTTDLLVFQKRRDNIVRNVNPFGTTTTIRSEVIDGELAEINVNEYYMANPDNMIGEMKFAFEVGSGGLYGKTDAATLNAKPGTDIQGRIKELIDKFPTDILNTDVSEEDTSISTNMKVGKMFSEKGKVYVSNGDQGYAPPFRKPEQNKIALAYLDVRDAIRDLVAKELTSVTDEEIEKDRANLNKVYDAFVKKYGTINKNDFLYDHDVEFSIAAAAEDIKESTVFSSTGGKSKKHVEVKKAAIFLKRINYPRLEPTTADNLSDAIQISLAYRNHINPEYIAQITNQSVDEAIENMIDQKLVFQNPINGLFETPEEYLSGDVRKKLEEARNIAATDANYSRNVVELEKVQPEDKPISQIPFKMGVSWIPAKMYMEFIAEKLGVKINIAYLDKAGIWALDTDRMQGSRDSNNTTTYAVGGTTGVDIISDIMANRTTVINKTVSNGSGGTMQVKDEVSTSAAKDMQDKIIDEFRNWIATHSSYGSEIEKEYNNRFNNLVEKQYSLPPFKFFPGASTVMQLRSHQFKSVQRGLSGNPLLLAHGVGTGKTAIMQTTAMEWRRLKTSKKPLIVVQNSTLKDFAAKFHKLYPGANLLVSSEADKGEAERRRFYARIAQGDWDAIIIPQSQFDRIPDNPDRVSAYLQERIEEMKQVLENTDDYFIKNRIQKEIEGLEDDIAKAYMTKDELAGLKTQAGEMYVDEETGKLVKGEAPVRTKSGKQKVKAEAEKILRLNASIQKQAARKTDNVMYFEDLGVDGLIVDEAHEYKKLGFQTGLQNIRGIDTGVSQKALSLYIKTAAVKEKTGGKNIIFATGTPITNTMAESWTMMRFLQPEALHEMGIQYFDQFAATFTEVVPSLEQNAGGRFEVVQRMKEFVNAKQLQAIFKRMADVVTTDDIPEFLSDPNNAPPQLEDGKFKAVLIPISKPMEATMKKLTQEYDNWKDSTGAEKKEKSWLPLVLYQVAKKAAIDLRIIDPRNIDDPESKVNYAVRHALEIYREFDEYKGTQMIFADNFQSGNSQIVQSILGVPSGLTPFNLYHDIKEKLIANGVPAKEIIIMSDVKTDSGKLAMQDKMNSGEVRFVLGSTSKMGIGVNAHERMIALHHIDAPDRPDQFTQRNGRILRSGNMFTKLGIPVKILTYGIKDTRDATSYGRLRDKDKFVTDFMTGKGGDRVEDTGEENESEGAGDFFSQMSAQLSGSKFATELIFAEKDLRTESNRSQAFYQKRRESEYKLSNKISGREEIISLIKQADEAVVIKNEHFPNNKITALTIDGKDIGEKTTEAVDNMITSVSKEYQSEAKRLDEESKAAGMKTSPTPKPILKRFKINGVDSSLQYSGGIFGDGDMKIFIPSLSLDGKGVSSGASLLSVVRNYVKDLDDQPQRYRDLLAKEEANIETLKRNLQDTYDDTRLSELIERVDYLKTAILQESEEKKAADKKEKEDAAALAKQSPPDETLLSTREGANDFQTADNTPVSVVALKKKYPGAEVVQSQTDLPSAIQEVAQENQLTVEGVLHNGKVYLVADNLETMGRAEGVYRHERIGHASVIAHLKDKLDGFARSLVNNATKAQTIRLEAMAQALYKKPIAELSIEEKSILGQEYIARAAENPAKSPVTWEKVVAFVRGVLRNLGIKLAVSDKDIKVLLDRAAKTQNTAPNATRFSPTEKKIKLADGTTVTGLTVDPEVVNGFYSPIEKKLLEEKAVNLSATKWLERLGKGDEMTYTGLKEFLESKGPAEQVKKQEVLDFIKNNRIEIVEVVKIESPFYGKSNAEKMEDIRNELRSLGYDLEQEMGGEWYVVRKSDGKEYIEEEDYDTLPERVKALATEHYEITEGSEEEGVGDTKYSGYQLPGEKSNYKEVLITMPNAEKPEAKRWAELAAKKFGERTEAEQKEYRELGMTLDKNEFQSSHFNEPNILAHVRMNDRVDADGKKVLFIEEIQSDWAQSIRKEGGVGTNNRQRVVSELLQKYNVKTEDELYDVMSQAEVNSIERAKNMDKNAPAAAPYVTNTNSWVKLALKTALKHAVDEGAERIAWTTGPQQADRYDISKQINRASLISNGDGTYNLVVEGRDGFEVTPYSRGGKSVTPSELDNIVGKAVAEKLIAGADNLAANKSSKPNVSGKQGFFDVEGLALNIGGEGMVGFYGDPEKNKLGIVGNIAESLFGKGSVKEIGVNTSPYSRASSKNSVLTQAKAELKIFESKKPLDKRHIAELKKIITEAERKESETRQHSVDITPSIKSQVKKGQPLFSIMQDNLRKAREAAAKAEAKAAKKASNIPADLKEFGDEFISYTKRKKADATADDVIGEMESERGTSFTDTEAPGLFDYIRSQFAGEEQQQPETPPVPPADKVNVSGTDEEVIRRVLERNIDDKEYPAYFTENETLKQDAAKTQGTGQDRFVDGAYVQAHLGDLRSISLENARILQNALGAKWKNKVVQFFEANPNAGNMAQVAGMLNVISTDVFNELAKTRNGNKVSELKYLQSRIDRIALSNARTASLTLNQRRLYQGFAQDKPISELLAEIILTPEQRNIKQGVEQSMKKEFTDAELNQPVPKQKQPATPKPPKEKPKPDPTSKIKKDLIARGQMAQQQEDGTGNVKKVTLADKIKQAADALKGFKC